MPPQPTIRGTGIVFYGCLSVRPSVVPSVNTHSRNAISLFISVYQSHQFPLASLSALLVETSSSLAPDFVLATGHSPSLVLRCGTVCRPIFDLHQHSAPSRIGSRLICFYSRILYFEFHQLNSSSVCCIRRPCSDFTDMLRRHINCRIIIIIIIIIIKPSSCECELLKKGFQGQRSKIKVTQMLFSDLLHVTFSKQT